jgi:hypothetical protein
LTPWSTVTQSSLCPQNKKCCAEDKPCMLCFLQLLVWLLLHTYSLCDQCLPSPSIHRHTLLWHNSVLFPYSTHTLLWHNSVLFPYSTHTVLWHNSVLFPYSTHILLWHNSVLFPYSTDIILCP